ncbi:2,3-bisphosphoglycerate-dependent phosphoglycerate mutase [Lacticaseibacillus parakribbianus]|uniref:2,3-bisphosphoglycerate-dependent phosphoglycerate mutase n=1 Tax=Lacticaseibacillus parakribbianus TaxID=2970927 RepID=UPI0021CB53ED|nr:2,3-diphosphoglycerate-dependent phosphoglycerate mutase [Lacticaseibacillus parakribbianus]
MVELVLLRHGESTANFTNTYTGWSDVPLTAKGVAQAQAAGAALAATGIQFGHVHTSVLQRAIATAYLVQDAIGQNWLPITKSWRLNERHYGALRGLNKQRTRDLFGASQVAAWRRSYCDLPPLLAHAQGGRRYAGFPRAIVPRGESLQDAEARLVPYWVDEIAPRLIAGQPQLVVAHGSTLRALIKYLEGISDAAIDGVEVANAQPIVYKLDAGLNILSKRVLPTH